MKKKKTTKEKWKDKMKEKEDNKVNVNMID